MGLMSQETSITSISKARPVCGGDGILVSVFICTKDIQSNAENADSGKNETLYAVLLLLLSLFRWPCVLLFAGCCLLVLLWHIGLAFSGVCTH